MSADECVHELPAGMCHLCKAPPPGVLKQGWRTKGGRAYHNDRECDFLRKGHRYAERRGNDVHDAVPVRWAEVDPGELQPCEHCCTPEWLRRHDRAPAGKPCLVRVGDAWVPGTLVWEPRARPDGLWWASVTHRAHGREVTETRSQHDLRKR
ncbi:hypothetical protein AB0A74_05740 [Saccharothrix sp. NPDC042600]|uniref:hypothetical protein n=1 Tax=Saccharothrix TaxID=2071 RepID=UPI0033F4E464